jgi:hypothetical protein
MWTQWGMMNRCAQAQRSAPRRIYSAFSIAFHIPHSAFSIRAQRA